MRINDVFITHEASQASRFKGHSLKDEATVGRKLKPVHPTLSEVLHAKPRP